MTHRAIVARVDVTATMNQRARTMRDTTAASYPTPSSTRGEKSGSCPKADAVDPFWNQIHIQATPTETGDVKEDQDQGEEAKAEEEGTNVGEPTLQLILQRYKDKNESILQKLDQQVWFLRRPITITLHLGEFKTPCQKYAITTIPHPRHQHAMSQHV